MIDLSTDSDSVIPRPLTSTIGREVEVNEIAALLGRPDVRLLVITGPGGIGKTRLSIEVAHAVAPSFAGGACFVPLAPVRDASGLLTAIANRLGVREAGERSIAELLVAFLGQRELVLVLDNFEQLITAGDRLNELLSRCPRLKLLVTSRTVLHLTGEFTYLAPPLPVSSPDDTEQPSDAVLLFEARARAVLPEFNLDSESRADVADICWRLDGLPLAIELAAARLSHLPLGALREQLGQLLGLLGQGPRDQPPRLQTMRNAIAWSYDLLDPELQRIFRSLCVLPGGFDLDAAAAVSGIDDHLILFNSVSDLLDCSLLRQRTGPNGSARYQMLEVVREFGVEQLERLGALRETQQRMAEWAVTLVESGWPQMAARTNQHVWLGRYDIEMANFRVVMSWLDLEQDSERFTKFAGGLFWYWYIRGHYTEGSSWLSRALDLPMRIDYNRFARARATFGLGILSHFQGDDARAIPLVEEALGRWKVIGDEWGQGICLIVLGIIAKDAGDYHQALARFTQALRHAEAAGDRPNKALAIHHLGIIQWGLGDLPEAIRLCTQALDIQRQIDDRWGAANSLVYLALFASLTGEHAQASDHLQESLRFRQAIGTPYETEEMASFLAATALLAVHSGQPELAARLFGAEHRVRTSIISFRGFPERIAYEDASSQTRGILGDTAFERAWKAGQTEPLEFSFALARDFRPAAPASSPERPATRTRPLDQARLTAREAEILALIAEGLTNADIAHQLFVTPGTVRIHVSNILRKLDATNRTEAVAIARRGGNLPPG